MFLLWSTPWAVCFDGEGEPGQVANNNAVEGGEGASSEETAKKESQPKTFTQEEVNAILAQDRRKHESKLKTMEKSLQDALENRNLSQEERSRLEQMVDEVKALSRTKEQQLIYERKQIEEQLSNKIKDAEEKATRTWSLFENSTIERSLLDAAVSNEAYNASQLVTILRSQSKLVEKKDDKGKPLGVYEVMVDLGDRDVETGEPIKTTRTPDSAVKRMKELPELYGNLFKNGVVSGLGGSSATGGVTPGKNGRLSREQIRSLSHEQYEKIRKEQPELLGLR
jgi:hypothetical protein